MEPRIISYRLDGEARYALFQMVNGQPVMTPCTAEGTLLEETK